MDTNSFMENFIIEALKNVYDPEIPVNIYDLGLIYNISISDGIVNIKMTLTSPNCPIAESLPDEVCKAIKKINGIKDVKIELVFDPPWTPDMMSENAKLELGML